MNELSICVYIFFIAHFVNFLPLCPLSKHNLTAIFAFLSVSLLIKRS